MACGLFNEISYILFIFNLFVIHQYTIISIKSVFFLLQLPSYILASFKYALND